MWSRSQAAGVASAAGEDAVGVAQEDQFAHRGGWVVLVDRRRSLARSRTGRRMTLPAGGGVPGEPVGQELGGGGAELLDRHRAGAVAGEVLGGEVQVEVHAVPPVLVLGACGVAAGQQVQGVLGVGEDPDRRGAADVEVIGVAERLELAGDAGDGLVEERGVGGVQGHEHVGGGGADRVLDPDAAAWRAGDLRRRRRGRGRSTAGPRRRAGWRRPGGSCRGSRR